MDSHSVIPPDNDPYVAFAILVFVLAVGIADIFLYCFWGQPYTISAYLRRVLTAYPTVLAIVSFSIGALFAHIFLSK
jgi:hypothetical protein